MTARDALREEVARLIDPLAFSEKYVRWTDPLWANKKAKRLADAVAKSDAILSLPAIAGALGGECETCVGTGSVENAAGKRSDPATWTKPCPDCAAPAKGEEPTTWRVRHHTETEWHRETVAAPFDDPHMVFQPLYASPQPDRLAVAVEALERARAALHQHYVDWDGEPEDAAPLQLARAECDDALAALKGETQ